LRRYGDKVCVIAGGTDIVGKRLTEGSAAKAAETAVAAAKPMTRNNYLIQVAKTMVKRALLACG
jgi:CO/xanthine dehydrogenase FAD-binding subunit